MKNLDCGKKKITNEFSKKSVNILNKILLLNIRNILLIL